MQRAALLLGLTWGLAVHVAGVCITTDNPFRPVGRSCPSDDIEWGSPISVANFDAATGQQSTLTTISVTGRPQVAGSTCGCSALSANLNGSTVTPVVVFDPPVLVFRRQLAGFAPTASLSVDAPACQYPDGGLEEVDIGRLGSVLSAMFDATNNGEDPNLAIGLNDAAVSPLDLSGIKASMGNATRRLRATAGIPDSSMPTGFHLHMLHPVDRAEFGTFLQEIRYHEAVMRVASNPTSTDSNTRAIGARGGLFSQLIDPANGFMPITSNPTTLAALCANIPDVSSPEWDECLLAAQGHEVVAMACLMAVHQSVHRYHDTLPHGTARLLVESGLLPPRTRTLKEALTAASGDHNTTSLFAEAVAQTSNPRTLTTRMRRAFVKTSPVHTGGPPSAGRRRLFLDVVMSAISLGFSVDAWKNARSTATKVNAAIVQMDTMQTKMNAVQGSITSVGWTVGNLTQTTDTINEQMKTLNNSMGTLSSSVTALKGRVDNMMDNIKSSSGTIIELGKENDKRFKDVDDRLNQLTATTQAFQNAIADNVTALQASMNATMLRITELMQDGDKALFDVIVARGANQTKAVQTLFLNIRSLSLGLNKAMAIFRDTVEQKDMRQSLAASVYATMDMAEATGFVPFVPRANRRARDSVDYMAGTGTARPDPPRAWNHLSPLRATFPVGTVRVYATERELGDTRPATQFTLRETSTTIFCDPVAISNIKTEMQILSDMYLRFGGDPDCALPFPGSLSTWMSNLTAANAYVESQAGKAQCLCWARVTRRSCPVNVPSAGFKVVTGVDDVGGIASTLSPHGLGGAPEGPPVSSTVRSYDPCRGASVTQEASSTLVTTSQLTAHLEALTCNPRLRNVTAEASRVAGGSVALAAVYLTASLFDGLVNSTTTAVLAITPAVGSQPINPLTGVPFNGCGTMPEDTNGLSQLTVAGMFNFLMDTEWAKYDHSVLEATNQFTGVVGAEFPYTYQPFNTAPSGATYPCISASVGFVSASYQPLWQLRLQSQLARANVFIPATSTSAAFSFSTSQVQVDIPMLPLLSELKAQVGDPRCASSNCPRSSVGMFTNVTRTDGKFVYDVPASLLPLGSNPRTRFNSLTYAANMDPGANAALPFHLEDWVAQNGGAMFMPQNIAGSVSSYETTTVLLAGADSAVDTQCVIEDDTAMSGMECYRRQFFADWVPNLSPGGNHYHLRNTEYAVCADTAHYLCLNPRQATITASVTLPTGETRQAFGISCPVVRTTGASLIATMDAASVSIENTGVYATPWLHAWTPGAFNASTDTFANASDAARACGTPGVMLPKVDHGLLGPGSSTTLAVPARGCANWTLSVFVPPNARTSATSDFIPCSNTSFLAFTGKGLAASPVVFNITPTIIFTDASSVAMAVHLQQDMGTLLMNTTAALEQFGTTIRYTIGRLNLTAQLQEFWIATNSSFITNGSALASDFAAALDAQSAEFNRRSKERQAAVDQIMHTFDETNKNYSLSDEAYKAAFDAATEKFNALQTEFNTRQTILDKQLKDLKKANDDMIRTINNTGTQIDNELGDTSALERRLAEAEAKLAKAESTKNGMCGGVSNWCIGSTVTLSLIMLGFIIWVVGRVRNPSGYHLAGDADKQPTGGSGPNITVVMPPQQQFGGPPAFSPSGYPQAQPSMYPSTQPYGPQGAVQGQGQTSNAMKFQ